MNGAGGATARLAEFCAGLTYDALPTAVVALVKKILLDTLGTTLAATTYGEGCPELVATLRTGGSGRATAIGLGERFEPRDAALVNGAHGHALNFDAGGDAGHVGSIVAAPLAAAQECGGVDGRRLITALAAGCEVTARLARFKRTLGTRGDAVLDGQLFGYFGAAGACGAIIGLTPEQLQSAFGLALMQAAGSMQVVVDGDPPAKAVYAAFSNHGGLLAAQLARGGLAAGIAAFEGRAGLFALYYGSVPDADALCSGLGETYALTNVAFKPWPCSGITHPFIEAAQRLGIFAPDDVAEIRLSGGTGTAHWFEPAEVRRRPPTAAAAANSIPYTVARMIESGEVALHHFSAEALRTPAPLVDRIAWTIDAALGPSALVEIRTRDGQVRTERVDERLGSRNRPMSDDQLRRKFDACAAAAQHPVDAGAIAGLVAGLEDVADIETLLERI